MAAMDKTIASWILTFVLRQPVEDWIANKLLSILPVSNDDLPLKKTIMIRRISSEIAQNSVSETTLDSLELIVDLDGSVGIPVTESMKKAYWATAIECTAQIWRESQGSSIDEAIDRIWNSRVAEVHKWGDGVGLASQRLKDMEVVVNDPEVREMVFRRDLLTFAVDSVKEYLVEAREQMGPSFLELRAELEEMHKDKDGGEGEVINGQERKCGSPELEDFRGGDFWPASSGSDVIDLEGDYASNAEFEPAVGDEGRRGEIEILPQICIGPLPDALKIAARVQSNMRREHISQKGPEQTENQVTGDITDMHSFSADKDVEIAVGEETRPSSMVRKETARTSEGDDSIGSSEKSPNCSRELGLPSPKHKTISPSDRPEIKNIYKRRKSRWWTPEEEETLTKAVTTHGKGNWKHILCCYAEVFEGRTEVDLKDKWRNLTREVKVPKY